MSERMVTQEEFDAVIEERVKFRVLLDQKLNPAVMEHNKEHPPVSADSLVMALLMYCADWIEQFSEGNPARKAVMFSQYADAFAKMAGFAVVHESIEDQPLNDTH